MDKMNTPFNIFLDLSKAFDTLKHQIFIKTLEFYGLNDLSLKHQIKRIKSNFMVKHVESYLLNRKQYVDIHGYNSDMLNLTNGVPQGAILFVYYIH